MEPAPARAAPSGGRPGSQFKANQLDNEQQQDNQLDKDLDSDSEQQPLARGDEQTDSSQMGATFGQAPARRQHHRTQAWPRQPQARAGQRHAGAHYFGPARPRAPFDDDDALADEFGPRARPPPPADDEYPRARHHQYAPMGSFHAKQQGRPFDFRQQQAARARGQARARPQAAGAGQDQLLVAPAARLDEGPDDELQPSDEGAHYAPAHELPAYPADDNFNQIQAPAAGARRHHHFRARHQQLAGVGARRRPDAGVEQQPNLIQAPASVTCAECQSGTRRLTYRQFCHLDYAIKATILSRLMADDWTRFDVEIQDIFKSPGSSLLQAAPSARGLAANYFDNLLQSDEPSAAPAQAPANKTGAVDGQATASQQPVAHQQQQQPAAHRLKVGSIQSVWVPTEDVACKCPRLKVKSTYLLLGKLAASVATLLWPARARATHTNRARSSPTGFVDAKEDSATSIQLDRHGVALEWKSALQDKLIKYQRRQSRRGC